MQSLIAVIFKEDMDRAEGTGGAAGPGRTRRAGGLLQMVAAVCDKRKERYTSIYARLAKDGALIGGVWAR
ncbi:MAG: hypothetical protein ACLSHC_16350 [Bilophila wadsworthia]